MGLFSGLFGDSSDTATQTTEPWGPQQGYLTDIFSQAQNWYNTPRDYYPGFSTVAPMNPYQIQGMEGMFGYANSPGLNSLIGNTFQTNMQGLNPYSNPFLSAGFSSFMPAQNTLMNAMNRGADDVGITGASGPTDVINRMMSATPNMDVWNPVMNAVTSNAVQGFRDQIMPEIGRATQASGQWMSDPKAGIATGLAADRMSENLNQTLSQMGLGAAQEAIGQQNLGAQLAQQNAGLDLQGQIARENAIQSMYGQGLNAAQLGLGGFSSLYNPTLDYSRAMMALAPQTGQFGMSPYSMMSGVGSQYQQQSQAELGDLVNRWQAENQGWLGDLGSYSSLVQGNYGGETTTPYYSNPLMSGLSGALGAGGLAEMMGWAGPVGGPAALGLGFLAGIL